MYHCNSSTAQSELKIHGQTWDSQGTGSCECMWPILCSKGKELITFKTQNPTKLREVMAKQQTLSLH